MKKCFCLMMALVMAMGSAAAAGKPEDDFPENIVANMSLRDKVSQMMIASFRIWKEVPEEELQPEETQPEETQPEEEPPQVNITELNDPIREMIGRNRFGGILLFGENFTDAEQTVRLVSDLQTTNRDGGGIPQIVFVDQEGESVNRVCYSTRASVIWPFPPRAILKARRQWRRSTAKRSACSGFMPILHRWWM